jgi:hypothetical protein
MVLLMDIGLICHSDQIIQRCFPLKEEDDTMNLVTPMILVCGLQSMTPPASFDIWHWTRPCQDLETFRLWTADLKATGFTQVEFSVPWVDLEPEPGVYRMDWLRDRLQICAEHGMIPRLRICSYWGGIPSWYQGETWKDVMGKEDAPQTPPSICDESFWASFGPFCSEVARIGAGYQTEYSAFIGIHAELKWSDWWSYDQACLDKWKAAKEANPRPEWLARLVGQETVLPDHPPVPGQTNGTPDLDPVARAWIGFREQCWREAVTRFNQAIRIGDASGTIYAPLGESYRRQSADMSNLDYWGLSRGAGLVQHSYDFFWHGKDPVWMSAATVSSFKGISGLPVSFEYDAEGSTLGLGYSEEQLLDIGREAAHASASLKVANYSYHEKLPSQYPLLVQMVEMWKKEWKCESPELVNPAETVLVFISKWANYSYREPTEWRHSAQGGVWTVVVDLGYPTRIICEDNLSEDLSGYRMLVSAFSLRELLPEADRIRLESLALPVVSDLTELPCRSDAEKACEAFGLRSIPVTHPACPAGLQDLGVLGAGWEFALKTATSNLAAYKPGKVILGYPIGYLACTSPDPAAQREILAWAILKALTTYAIPTNNPIEKGY